MSWYAGGVNQKTLTNGAALYQIIVTLVACGWTVLGSGDGTGGHYSATDGTAVTSGKSGPNGFLNTGSWMRIQSPVTGVNGQKREFVFQQGAASSTVTIRIKYSPNVTGSTGFTGGSPSATRVPSATDEAVVAGSGTDASPTYAGWGAISDYEFAFHVIADNTGDDGYAFVLFQSVNATGALSNSMVFAMDIMKQGTSQANDLDNAVIYFSGTGNMQADLWGGTACFAFVGGISSTDWVGVRLCQFQQTGLAPALALGSDALTNLDSSVIPHWVRFSTTNPGNSIKGYSSLFQFSSSFRGAMYPVQVNPNAKGDRLIVVGDSSSEGVSVPWIPNTPCYVS
jgi:hypothetical protein